MVVIPRDEAIFAIALSWLSLEVARYMSFVDMPENTEATIRSRLVWPTRVE